MRLILAACLGLAALSIPLSAAPNSDAWAWIVWGREILDLDLVTTNGPSWKPLPVLFTVPGSLFGDASPELWLVVARAGGLLAAVFAYRLAARFGGVLAGALAAVALVSVDWFRFVAHGESEPLVAAFVLWGVERHLDGRHDHAFALAFLAALGRVEAWPFFGLYGLYLFLREPERRLLVVALFAALPAAWFGLDYWGSGNLFNAGEEANTPTPTAASGAERPALEVVKRTLELVLVPVLVLAAAGLALAARRRERTLLALAGAGAAWTAIVAVMAEAGYTGNERYLFPVAGVICVLAGVGAGWAARMLGRGKAVAVGALALAAAVPFTIDQARDLRQQGSTARERDRARQALDAVARRVGGREGVRACGNPAITRGGLQGQLAWRLDLSLEEVERPDPPAKPLEIRLPGVLFDDKLNRPVPVGVSATMRTEPLAQVAGWRVLAVTGAGDPKPPGCRPAG